jgi:Uma2 family endonuclease
MADNTLQYEWIVMLKSNLEFLFRDDPAVFVAADLLWYPVEGRPDLRRAPDVMVAFGRPKGYRGSYLQWREQDIAPQVVIEILSPGNTAMEMNKKLLFYQQHGVEEFCTVEPDPENPGVVSWRREGEQLVLAQTEERWDSQRLGISIALEEGKLVARDPKGNPMRSPEDIHVREQELEAQNAAKDEEIARLRAELKRLKGE